ncbi:DNA polymerase LigD domain protein [Mycobacteroides abscessus 1948]|uniref:DNA polymerase LigD domain protein n=1 Tax=Mycobacteroides abscessus 1948 TaxID=1299323 RepID=A0A829QK02_9MYCO|nr:DNA polymerase LigD domain protein [Mycobacteroides abscessus 1948]
MAGLLEPQDILIDGMRGPSSVWYRVRINLVHVPEGQRPAQEELIADYSPWS